jgi:hypothetical protein
VLSIPEVRQSDTSRRTGGSRTEGRAVDLACEPPWLATAFLVRDRAIGLSRHVSRFVPSARRRQTFYKFDKPFELIIRKLSLPRACDNNVGLDVAGL